MDFIVLAWVLLFLDSKLKVKDYNVPRCATFSVLKITYV
jgi:hypothetical protein